MPRPMRWRRIFFEPNINYFKPFGITDSDLEDVVLRVDELEAVRLKDLMGFDQEEAAKKMNVSQPTFHRILTSARKKIADAVVNAKALRIEGGKVKMVRAGFGGGPGRGFGRRRGMGFKARPESCVCPKCGYRVQKAPGVPCSTMKCPKCGSIMVRE